MVIREAQVIAAYTPHPSLPLERQFIGIHIGHDNDLMKCLLIAVHPQGLMVEAPSVEGAPEMARLLDPDATAEASLAFSAHHIGSVVSGFAVCVGFGVCVEGLRPCLANIEVGE